MNSYKTCSYNLKIAEIFGIHSAVFIDCIIFERDYQKRIKNDFDNTIALSSDEIYARTALSLDKLHDVEQSLSNCGVISIKPFQKIKNKSYYILNDDQLERILTANSPSNEIMQLNPIAFSRKTNINRVKILNKKDLHIIELKKSINVDDELIRQYLCDWIDAVYTNPKGFLSNSSLKIAINELLDYALNDQEKQINILQIAIKGGLRDMTWAISKYEQLNNTKNSNNFVSYNNIKSKGDNVINEEF